MNMLPYITRRLLQAIPVIFAIVVINFTLVHIAPGNPADVLAGPFATPAYVAHLKQSYGLDQPLPVQFVDYIDRLVHGDLGQSLAFSGSVWSVISSRIPATLLLVLTSQLIGIVLGTLLGTLAARRYGSWWDGLLSVLSLGTFSMPVFWFGLLLILVFAVDLHWLPASGMHSLFGASAGFAEVGDVLRHLILPVTTLSVGWTIPTYLRLARASVAAVSQEDFITTARAKGLTDTQVFFRHALRNALLPIVTTGGLYIGLSLGGAVLTETVFAWPGVGQLMYQAIFSRDYPTLIGIFLITSVGVVLVTLLTDLLYAFLDPRVTYSK